jgi:hypothetical protein
MIKTRVTWKIEKPKIRLTSMDCDEVHINRKTLTIFNSNKAEEIDLSSVTEVTFGTVLGRTQAHNEYLRTLKGDSQ